VGAQVCASARGDQDAGGKWRGGLCGVGGGWGVAVGGECGGGGGGGGWGGGGWGWGGGGGEGGEAGNFIF